MHLQFCLRRIKMSNDFLNKQPLKTSRDDSKTELSADFAAVKPRVDGLRAETSAEVQFLSWQRERERERASRNKFNVPIKTGGRSE